MQRGATRGPRSTLTGCVEGGARVRPFSTSNAADARSGKVESSIRSYGLKTPLQSLFLLPNRLLVIGEYIAVVIIDVYVVVSIL